MMKIRNALFVVASIMLATATVAGEKIHKEIKIVVDDGSDSGETHLSLNSDDMGFELEDLQVGETRSIVDESGRSVLITREDSGYNVNVDGKSIDLPDFNGAHGAMCIEDGGSCDVDVHVIRDAKFISSDNSGGVTIVSAEPIDDVTREGIKSLLTSSGHSDDVNFIDGSGEHGGMHKIKIIKKKADTSL